MVGNTYPYTVTDWEDDIILASENNLDGFVLNVGCEPWQKERVSDCFDALSRIGRHSEFMSFDMHSIRGSTADDVNLLLDYICAFSISLACFGITAKLSCRRSPENNTILAKRHLNKVELCKCVLENITPGSYLFPLHVPSELSGRSISFPLLSDPAVYLRMPCIDGDFNWNGGWPLHSTRIDDHHLRHLGGKTFMAAVSPWFFTHYGPDTWNKNWVYRGDDWLFVRRWEQLIARRNDIDIVQVISWNDYGESHYIGPIKGAQPNSQAWVDGFPHTAWLALNSYYALAFKEGRYPPIKEDKIFVWARPHLKTAYASDDSTDDKIWVVVFSTGPGILTLQSHEYAVQAGVTKTWMPLEVGRGAHVTLSREHVGVVARCTPTLDEFCCTDTPKVYNFNAFTAMSGP
ncbi:glycosyl hydrolase family 71-domain-containing protein [Mucidula mucida]|nr:glycosyl hydrolase family 71-domain-containing protein [Mucidula mucida]